jgi:hypothetical protein
MKLSSGAALGLGPLFVVLATAALAGCGRTVTEADCEQIKKNMREAWELEAAKATSAATPGPGADKATAVIGKEREALLADWGAECKQQLVGRRVEPDEMKCLLSAQTIAAISGCAKPQKP